MLYIARRVYPAKRIVRNSLSPAIVSKSAGEGLNANDVAAARPRMSLLLAMVTMLVQPLSRPGDQFPR